MIDWDAGTVSELARSLTPEEKEHGRNIWSAFIQHVLAHKGPFWKTKKPVKESKILDLACELFPTGPPQDGVKWKLLENNGSSKFAELAQLLIGRSVPLPLSKHSGGMYPIYVLAVF